MLHDQEKKENTLKRDLVNTCYGDITCQQIKSSCSAASESLKF